jgi:hypothetical protein
MSAPRQTDITIFQTIRLNAMAGKKVIYAWADRSPDPTLKRTAPRKPPLSPSQRLVALEAFRQAFIRHFSRKEQGQ